MKTKAELVDEVEYLGEQIAELRGELKTTKAVLGDLLEERDLGRLFSAQIDVGDGDGPDSWGKRELLVRVNSLEEAIELARGEAVEQRERMGEDEGLLFVTRVWPVSEGRGILKFGDMWIGDL